MMNRKCWMMAGMFAVALLAGGCGPSAFQPENPNKAAEQRWKRIRAGVKRQLADSQLKAGHLPEALRELEEALALDSTSAQAFVLMARIRLEQGQIAAARQSIGEALALAPSDGEATYVAGLVAERCEQWTEAEQYYARASAAAPQESEYVIARAEALVALGKAVEALDWIESREDHFIEDPRLRAAAAGIYAQLGMNAAAADRFEQAARASDDNREMKLELGLALSAARRDVEAAGVLAPLLTEKNPAPQSTAAGAYALALARSQYRLGRLKEARRTLDALTQRECENGGAWLLAARVACDQRDWPTARHAANQAVKYRGDAAEAHLIRACVCRQQNDLAESLNSARLAIQRDPRDATGYCMLGQTYEAGGEKALARAAYFDALAHDSQSTLARALLARLQELPVGEKQIPAAPLPQATAMALPGCDEPPEVDAP